MMAILDPIVAKPLSVRLIASVAPAWAKQLALRPEQVSLGIFTADNDDATYVSIDEATKSAQVEVVYAQSFYAGARHASGKLSGEVIAMLAGSDPEEVRSGLDTALRYMEEKARWYSADEGGGVSFFPHVVSRAGSYLSKLCGVAPGSSLAYLVAPPLEGCFALDAALKEARVDLAWYKAPPSETNFMCAILSGELPACEAAARAFQEAVLEVVRKPIRY
jgi:ethanolamine utilization protein EutL